MKKIMIDMDNVICEGGYLNVVNKFLKTNYKIEDVKDYYVQNLIPMTRMQEWEEFWANENFYDYYISITDGVFGINKTNIKDIKSSSVIPLDKVDFSNTGDSCR